MMQTWTRMLLVLLTSACAVGGTSDTQSKRDKKTKHTLTLQLQEKYIDGQAQAALILCQQGRCLNPLLARDGSAFYFQNHAEAYNTFSQKSGAGEKVKFALLGIAAVTGTAGIIFLIRHGLIGRKLDKGIRYVDKQGNEIAAKLLKGNKDRNKTPEYFIDNSKSTLSDTEASELNKQADRSLGAGLTVASIGAVAWITAFAKELTTDPRWRRKQKDFERLFVQGERITVTKKELATLLQVMNKKLGVRVAPPVARFLFSR